MTGSAVLAVLATAAFGGYVLAKWDIKRMNRAADEQSKAFISEVDEYEAANDGISWGKYFEIMRKHYPSSSKIEKFSIQAYDLFTGEGRRK